MQQHFSSREDEALLQDYNVSFFYWPPAGGSAAVGEITTPSSVLTEPLQVGKWMALVQVMAARIKRSI